MNIIEKLIRYFNIYILAIPGSIVVFPFRWIFDFFTIYHPDLFRSQNNTRNHEYKVKNVQDQIIKWNKDGRKKKMCTARPQWQTLSMRSLNKSKYTQIKIDLEDIIEIDAKNKILRVEPGMKMGTLTHRLLSKGWTIPVIPEFESLTIGGCVNGTGIETSSHKYGLFADMCLEYEVVLTDGSVVKCSKNENPDLFEVIPWSHGTIGFLTAVSIPLIPAAKYVKVEYLPTNSIQHAKTLLSKSGYDFIEGIAFGINRIVVMYGTIVDVPEKDKINFINRWYKPWFFRHVESFLKNGAGVEYIPARDYYHRHQRAYFWELDLVVRGGNSLIVRYLFGWLYPFNFQFMKYLVSEYFWNILFTENHVLQDFLVPLIKLEDFLHLSHVEVEVYPIWLCPCKFFKGSGLARLTPNSDEMYIDVGIYGISPKTGYDPKRQIKKFEKLAIENNGFQFLYADTYLTREEFKKMFNTKTYDAVRKDYNSEDGFPEIYDKISRKARK